MNADDRAVVDRWWQHFLTAGRLPYELELVQGRLVRAVYRGQLPSGPVHVKAMAFPRAKDRLRYLLRALPGQHEAAMLRAVAAAGIPCPAVLDVRSARHGTLPFRSLLVLRTLPTAVDHRTARERLLAEAALALRLLAHGILHRDLHTGNFLPLADGSLAVLDLQSASRTRPRRDRSRRLRLALAARLARERPGLDDALAMTALREAGLLLDDGEQTHVHAQLTADRRRFLRTRVMRCLQESTEFTRQLHWSGCEYRLRSGLGPAVWWQGGRALRRAWLGQRVLQLECGRPLGFSAYFQKWWWLGGAASLYVAERCSGERIPEAVKDTSDAWDRFAALLRG